MLDIEISQASAVIAPATRFLLAWWMLCWLYTCFALHKILCIVYFCWHCILLHFYFYLFLVLSPLPYLHYHLLYIINYLPFSTTSLTWSEIFNQAILRYYYPTHLFNYPPFTESFLHSTTVKTAVTATTCQAAVSSVTPRAVSRSLRAPAGWYFRSREPREMAARKDT